MKRKIAIAFAGLLLMLTASFAPIARAQVPGSAIYASMGGKVDGRMFIYVNTVAPNTRYGLALPFNAPFVTRDPWLTPNILNQSISFAPPIDVDQDGVYDIIQIQKIQLNPIVHHIVIGPPLRPTPTIWRMTLVALAPGGGVIFINPAMPGDVDCYTVNNDTGVYWAPPSPLAGQQAAASGGWFDMITYDFNPPMAARLPGGGADGIPGTALWGDPLDGFGDGVPDAPGSSILMLPTVLMGEEWNGTAWVQTIFVPMPLVMTTAVAWDHVVETDSYMYSTESTEEGLPWEFMSVLPWDPDLWAHPKAFVKVIYVCAWSNLLYSLNPDDDGDGVPDPEEDTGMYYTVDLFYEYTEKKVREDVKIMDINCDQTVNIIDLVIAGVSFGAEDEGMGRDGLPNTADDKAVADPNFDPRADVDGSGFIDIVDVVAIGLDFGQSIDPGDP